MRIACWGILLMMVAAPAAMAQTGKHIAIGGAIGVTSYADHDFSTKNPGFSLAYRLNPKPARTYSWKWGVKGDLGWSRHNTTTDIGGVETPLGKLQTGLIMGGIQRSMQRGRWQGGVAIVAGPSFHQFDIDGRARDAYESRLGTDLADIKVKTSVAVRPEAIANYDLNQWLGVQGTLSYLIDRPKAETTSGGATTSRTWKTDRLSAGVALVVGIF